MGEPSPSDLPGETDSQRRLPSPHRGRARRQENSGDEENQRERSCSRVQRKTTLSALPEQPASLASLSPRVRRLASSPPSSSASSSSSSAPSSSCAPSSSASSSSSAAPSSSRCSSSPMQRRVLTSDGGGGNTAGALASARRRAGRTEASKTGGDEQLDDEASRVHTPGEQPQEQRRRARCRVGSKGGRRRGNSLRRGARRHSEERPCMPPSPSFASSSLSPAEERRQAATPSSLPLASSPLSSCPLFLRPLRVSLFISLLFALGLGVLLFLATPLTLRNGARDSQRLFLPYCNKTRNLPLALVDNSPAPPPPALAARSRDCVPCPAHAVCLNGEMRCVPPYIQASTRSAALESLLARFGVRATFLRSFFVLSGLSRGEDASSCVEDEAAKETAKRVTDAVVLFLRSKAGKAQCASFAPLGSQQSQQSPRPVSAPPCEEGVESGRGARHTVGCPDKSVFQGRDRDATFARRTEKMFAETRGTEEIEEHSGRSSLSGRTSKSSGALSGERSARESRPSESATRWEIIQLAQVKDLLEDDNVYAYVFNHFLDEETAERNFSVRVEQTYSFQSLDLVVPTENAGHAASRTLTHTLDSTL
ncbi:Man1-Src1p-carboxy-terminal domain protein [Toxoplasma gondii MAS]|uniref:Man1-Src1p-carboxy-terminal domain protein n=1 Tax=Toxoplasma gondii MAS TaxID=943118 RepID=A0A086QW29_TOXGO|nr:Man1-Src1p-carboxy-terminal domain protein [Toxoplasma gondii MAS]